MSETSTQPTDTFSRSLHDLRISVTDRCNFRCGYCMPRELFGASYQFLDRKELLTFEEITRVSSLFVQCGVRKIRLTGGEPLLRRDIHLLIEMLAKLPDLEDLTLTTNGSVLTRERARGLKNAGLNRITVSLDALDDETFKAMNDVGFPVSRVLKAVENAAAEGLEPVKVNVVVKRGMNEHAIVPMARHFKGSGHIVRYIEYMDVGNSNGWRLDDVVPANEIAATIDAELPIEPASPNYNGAEAMPPTNTSSGRCNPSGRGERTAIRRSEPRGRVRFRRSRCPISAVDFRPIAAHPARWSAGGNGLCSNDCIVRPLTRSFSSVRANRPLVAHDRASQHAARVPELCERGDRECSGNGGRNRARQGPHLRLSEARVSAAGDLCL
jgi:cyclic pyranopterin phosphate synthase